MRSGSDGGEAGRWAGRIPAGFRLRCTGREPALRLVRTDRTVALVQRASRADGPVPSAEIRHP
ncbi:hypothetical protein C6Y14_31430 [Streptomyces dioscori]|uniref:Uncharacterized protein n=1 Tax=Streptomyces dioscori TaxID=2109333 RepID=A0A2P8PZH4_9ACTN|nr:hypothetical protein C6Y14_31430 [Streptomyces dioscori]